MICPQCAGEFVDGIYECPDCQIPLKHEWELEEPEIEQEEFVIVFETADVSQIPFVKSLLDAAAIPHILQGEQAVGILAMPPLVANASHSAFATCLLVPKSREQEARELIADLEREELDDS